MVDYPYASILVADAVTFQRAANASVTVYDITDTGNTTPLALTDLSGLALPNPLTSSSDAFLPPFVAQVDGVKLVGGGLTIAEYSHKGMKDAAEASRVAAEAAAANAATAAEADLAARIAAGEFKGDKGADGSNVLPTAQAVQDSLASGVPVANITGQTKVGSVRFKDDPQAMAIVEVPGTNGRRLSIQPVDQLTSTGSAQLEIVPGGAVSPAEVTSQILLYHKTGANYERFVISCFNGEYQFHASRLGTGTTKPTFFYVDNTLVTAWMPDATFRVYKQLDFYDQTAGAVWGSLKAYAADTIGTGAKFRVDEGGSGQIRLGDVAALGRPTIMLGADGTVNINRNGGVVEVSGADVEIATVGKGLIAKSPDGTRYRLTPPNGGGAATWVPA